MMPERRNTKQSAAIHRTLVREQRPLSIEEIHEGARDAVPTLGVRTVYRVLQRLEEEGDVVRVAIRSQADRYELAEAASRHHHHFHCLQCDRVYDIEGCPGHLDGLLPDGFKLAGHEITLYGSCDHCG